ncbi:MAG: transcriptional repressor [Phycicoccus sp.]|nr:transcriptional repressor [Phycicoccus sp.]
MDDAGPQLRARGRRLTSQRARVLAALEGAGHVTPEELVVAVAADGGPALPASTVYRALDALQESGLVDHTHVDHRVPSYHLAHHANHVHLLCRGCGAVLEVSRSVGDDFAAEIARRSGFVVELGHAAIHGHCADCQECS